MKYKILVVDDEAANLRLLERIFASQYDVITAGSGPEGLEMLAQHDVALIISDQRMPGMTGIEFLQKAAEMRMQCIRIILTGYTDANALIEAVNSRVVYKYVTKPWVNSDLLQTVKRALSHYEAMRAQHLLNMTNERLKSRLDAAEASFVELFMYMLDARDGRSRARAERVRDTAVSIGRRLEFEPLELKQLATAAYLHEAAEFNIAGDGINAVDGRGEAVQFIESAPGLDEVASSIRYWPERFDGNGGSYGLAREQIPLHARIISVAVAFERLTADDGSAMSRSDAEAEIRLHAGSKFDPAIVEAFLGGELVGAARDQRSPHTSRLREIRSL